MHSYQSRWEELFTNQQGQVMTNFKLGDWARVIEGHAKNNIFKVTGLLGTDILLGNCFNYKADHCTLWTPEEGEWCWFWGIFDLVPKLAQFIDVHSKGYHAKTFSANDSSYYSNVEPFIGQLPTILKDNT